MNDNPTPDSATVLRRYGLRPKHSLGQNFLDDPAALELVTRSAEISAHDFVLEIGAGLGNLTRWLAGRARRVVAVELDSALAAVCRDLLKGLSNVEVRQGDVLNMTASEMGLPAGYIVAANIPYYITSAILRHLLEAEPRPRRVVLTVQKEVAARLSASPPDMSLLAVSVQVQGTASVIGLIAPGSFYPRPKVNSAVVRIDCFAQPRVLPSDADDFFTVVRAGFLQPRKMLRNSMSAGLHSSPPEVEAVLRRADIEPRRRAGTLTVEEWIRVFEVFSSSVG